MICQNIFPAPFEDLLSVSFYNEWGKHIPEDKKNTVNV